MADNLESNLSVLAAVDAELAQRIRALGDDARVALEPSRSGPPTVRLAGPDGVARYLHSRYDPVREAASLVDANIDERSLCHVLFGCGLGYAAAQLLDRLPGEAAVVVVEPNPALLAAAMELHDWSADIRAGRLAFVTADTAAHVHRVLKPLDLTLIAGTRLIAWPAAEQLAGPFLARARQAIVDYIAFARMAMVTLLLNNETTVRNIANNLARYVAAPPVQVVRGRFAGWPAVVVSAGPSLHNKLAELKRLDGRAVLIAVQTALRPLLDAGIRPHFVTTLDYGELGQRFYQGFAPGQLADIHLIAEPKANWKVIDAFEAALRRASIKASSVERRASNEDSSATGQPWPDGPMLSFLGNDIADRMLGLTRSRHDRLPAGLTVAHLAFYLAQYLGCDPIIFVGQDLGFSNHTYYTPGTAIHQVWAGEINRYNSIESMEWQRIVRDGQGLRRLTDVHGRPIYTDEQMFVYLQQFERDFATAPQTIIDATGGGVRKAGAKVMDLAEAARLYAIRPLPADGFDYRRQTRWFDASQLNFAEQALTERIEQVEQLRTVCQETLELLDKLGELLTSDPAGFNRTIALVDEKRAWVREHRDVLMLVAEVSALAEFRKYSADRALRLKPVEGVEKRKFQLARDRAYVSAVGDGCRKMLAILDQARRRVQDSKPACSGRRDE